VVLLDVIRVGFRDLKKLRAGTVRAHQRGLDLVQDCVNCAGIVTARRT